MPGRHVVIKPLLCAADDHEDGSENAVIECKADGCEERLYVTQLCNGIQACWADENGDGTCVTAMLL
jgi:hypothetical protein